MPAIYFDMDGTLADFYGVDGWLDYIHNEDTTPYDCAAPLIDTSYLSVLLNQLKNIGYTLGIISWSAKDGTKEYNKAVRASKLKWIKKYFGSLFDEFHVVKYGTSKNRVAKAKNAILFDDNADVRAKWQGESYAADDIIMILTGLVDAFNQMPQKLIKEALQKELMAYCYLADDRHGETFVKVGMTTRGERRIKEYRLRDYSTRRSYYYPTNKKYVVFFPCKNEYDAYAMECALHYYFFFYDKEDISFYPNDRFYKVPAKVEEMLQPEGFLMQSYHKLGY